MNKNFKDFLTRVLGKLSESLGADKNTLGFASKKNEDTSYSNSVTIQDYISKKKMRLHFFIRYGYRDIVLCQAIDAICSHFNNNIFLDFEDISNSFYDDEQRCYLTPEGLAAKIHEKIQKDILRRYSSALKIDFVSIFEISEMLYESDTAHGTISFLKQFNGAFPEFLQFTMQTPSLDFTGENLGFIRKLLAGVGKNTLLFVLCENAKNYMCYGYVNKDVPLPFKITLEDKNSLLFKIADQSVFRIKNRKILCLQDILQIRFNELKDEFKNAEWDKISEIIIAVSEQTHGASIVFLDLNRKSYGNHLKNLKMNERALACKLDLTRGKDSLSSLHDLARMDGAIVIDIKSAEIKYINVIVDGISISKGDLSSGARHNTIKCFVDNFVKKDIEDNKESRVAALIFSESGGVKLVRGSERKLALQNAPSKPPKK